MMLKFNFSIQTRDGQRIINLAIAGRDQEEAEHKLRQMYRNCEIVGCDANQMGDSKTQQVISIEDIITLISK
jgi:hypothetical protein